MNLTTLEHCDQVFFFAFLIQCLDNVTTIVPTTEQPSSVYSTSMDYTTIGSDIIAKSTTNTPLETTTHIETTNALGKIT